MPSGTTSPRATPSAAMSCFMPNCGWPLVAVAAGPSPPIAFQPASSRSWSRPGRTTAPFGKAGDRLQELGRRRHRTGRAGCDHRTGSGCGAQALRLGPDERVAPGDRIGETALREKGGPRFEGDLQEIEGDLEVAGMILRREAADLLPRDAGGLHVVHQPGEVGGQPRRVGGRGGDEQRFVRGRGRAARGERRDPRRASVRRG